MRRRDDWKRRLSEYQSAYRELAGRLAELGFIHEGTVVRQRLTCGKSSCVCHSDPERRHGPYFYWTAKVKGRTVSRLLAKEEADLYEEWIRNRRRFREIQRKMLALAKKALPVAVKIRRAGSGSEEQPRNGSRPHHPGYLRYLQSKLDQQGHTDAPPPKDSSR